MGIYTKTASGWIEIEGSGSGELPGIGGWAEITAVTGAGTKYEYTIDGMEWSAFEFTGNGSFTIGEEDGLIEFLLVSSASRWISGSGGKGGGVIAGADYVDGGTTISVIIGKTANTSVGEGNGGRPSALNHANGEVLWTGDFGGWASPPASGNGGTQVNGDGVYSRIFGTKRGFGGGSTTAGHPYGVKPPIPNSGAASETDAVPWPAGEPQNQGVVGIRVPAANDKTGITVGPFDTRTLAEKAAQAAKDQIQDTHTSPVTQDEKD